MDYGTSHFVCLKNKNLHYRHWGNSSKPAIIIWHGVTGTSLDHIELANQLSLDHYVICPESLGCGYSDWPDNHEHASLSFHTEMAEELFRHLKISNADWIGTSKGGALGICYAARGKHCRIGKLILHDVGPGLPEKFRQAVARHISQPPCFNTLVQFEAALRKTLGRDGLALSDSQWQLLAQAWARRRDDGKISYHYSPVLAEQFTHHPEDFDLWSDFEKISSQILVIKGEHSVVLNPSEAQRMLDSNDNCRIKSRSGGHISFLSSIEETDIIQTYLTGA